mgnify:CR=1 FL=1
MKRWTLVALAAALARELGSPIGLTGGRDDVELVGRVRAAAGPDAIARAWTGATSLLQLAELARRASLVVSCDTGPMHIAAAVELTSSLVPAVTELRDALLDKIGANGMDSLTGAEIVRSWSTMAMRVPMCEPVYWPNLSAA